MVVGLGLLSIGLRLAGLAFMFDFVGISMKADFEISAGKNKDFEIIVQQGAFWYCPVPGPPP